MLGEKAKRCPCGDPATRAVGEAEVGFIIDDLVLDFEVLPFQEEDTLGVLRGLRSAAAREERDLASEVPPQHQNPNDVDTVDVVDSDEEGCTDVLSHPKWMDR